MPDTLSINFENSIVIESHVQCAAEEEPINTIQDQVYFGDNLPNVCQEHLTSIDNNVREYLIQRYDKYLHTQKHSYTDQTQSLDLIHPNLLIFEILTKIYLQL